MYVTLNAAIFNHTKRGLKISPFESLSFCSLRERTVRNLGQQDELINFRVVKV